jgi:hypothetical protein
MLPTKFRFIWQSGFREEYFLEINQSETKIALGGHVCQRIGTKLAFLLGQMNQNLVGSIRERSSIKNAHLVPIC